MIQIPQEESNSFMLKLVSLSGNILKYEVHLAISIDLLATETSVWIKLADLSSSKSGGIGSRENLLKT